MQKRAHPGVLALAVAGIGGGLFLLRLADWPPSAQALSFAVLMLAAVASATFDQNPPTTRDRATAPSFVIDFASLLLFGAPAMTIVATTGSLARVLSDSPRSHLFRRALVHAACGVAAAQAAGFAHARLGGTLGAFAWPWQAVPIAAAVLLYCGVRGAFDGLAAPLLARQPVGRSWLTQLTSDCPLAFVAAGVAVALVEIVAHRAWNVLSVAAVPLYFMYRAHNAYARQRDGEVRHRDLIASLDQGMAVVDHSDRVTLWNEALARIVNCPREQALGRSLVGAVPLLGQTELPNAIKDARAYRRARTLSYVHLTPAAGARMLEVRILPNADAVMLLWDDITERTRTERALRRTEERFALAAEGANDGLWEWDLHSKEFYRSSRWQVLLGLPPGPGSGRPDEWFDRVHADDIVPLKAAIDAHLSGQTDRLQHEHRIRHEDGTYRWFLCRGVAMPGRDARQARIAGSLTDVTERATAQERIRNAGFRDPLTGLSNRAVFVEGLGQRLNEMKRRGGGFAVLYLDLDRFKIVNDSLGHLVGDELLTGVSRRLESCLRPGDAIARLGGDEFAVLLNGLGDQTQANAIAFRIQAALSAPFSIGGREVFTSASIGIAFSRAEYAHPEEIMRDADTAMYHAKGRGKARHELFDADMHARALDRLGLENDLRHAVKSGAFEVHYQPIVSLATRICAGFEALVRWKRNGVAVSPAEFVPVAEELGLIEPLGTWVLQEACRTFADWQRRFPAVGLDCITVNVSTRQLMQQNFLYLVEQAVHEARMKPADLRLEITETALMDNPRHAADVLRGLRDFGVKIYLDDFGTGYSSLSHLHKLPVDALKIDRSFVRSLLLQGRPAIVESILALARTLDTGVVAEGVESDQQARELQRLGCRHAQGYFFSPPLTPRSVEELLLAHRPLGERSHQSSGEVVGSEPHPSWPLPRAATTPGSNAAPSATHGENDRSQATVAG